MLLTPAAAARRGARALRIVARHLDRLGDSSKVQINSFMASWDMVAEPDEQFYLAQYWHWLEPLLGRLRPDARILDVGCGQGRLTLPLAAALPWARVVGVDASEDALASAKGYVAARRFGNVELHAADAVAFLSKEPDSSVDLVLFVEVTEWMDQYREALAEIARVLKPGAALFASFRSQYYQLLREVQRGRLDAARTAYEARGGFLGDIAVWFNWHTTKDVRLLLSELGFDIEGVYGIGAVSGTPSDPLSAIVRPARLPQERREQLLDLEVALAEQYAGQGRYIAAVATKHAAHARSG
jgi:2-polyprenyl-3-methyl-5-hydroxy-6-metoxy-1,4-benzoquinol methylase